MRFRLVERRSRRDDRNMLVELVSFVCGLSFVVLVLLLTVRLSKDHRGNDNRRIP